jgi:hypothetical protein
VRVDDPQLLAVEVQLAQQRLHRVLLIGRQCLVGQPAAALDPEHVAERAARDQVAVQDRLNLILQSRALPDQLGAPGDLAAQRLGVLVGDPHRRQIVRGQKFGQHGGVDLVGLDLRLSDRPGLHRIGHDHPRHVRFDHADDRMRVARRLDRDLILRTQPFGEDPQRLVTQRDLPRLADQTVFPDRDLRELAVDIQTDASASHTPPPSTSG